MKKDEKEDAWLNIVTRRNVSPDKLNEEGKRDLASEIVDKMSIEEVNQFIKKYGYKR